MSTFLTLLSYTLGAFILYLVNVYWMIGYFVLVLASLFTGMEYRCRFCYYYGKRCASGMGILVAVIFEKGASEEFKNNKNLILPAIFDFANLFLPIVMGVILIITKFSNLVLALFIFYLAVVLFPGFFLRKNLYCKNCKQGELGCPAYNGMKGKKNEE